MEYTCVSMGLILSNFPAKIKLCQWDVLMTGQSCCATQWKTFLQGSHPHPMGSPYSLGWAPFPRAIAKDSILGAWCTTRNSCCGSTACFTTVAKCELLFLAAGLKAVVAISLPNSPGARKSAQEKGNRQGEWNGTGKGGGGTGWGPG